MADDEDDHDKYGAADRGREYDGLGFLRFATPTASIEPAPDAPEQAQEAPGKPQGKVIPSITPSDELRLYGDLYASYGHPSVVKAKAAYVWALTAVCVFYMTQVALSPLYFCVLGAVVGVVALAYITTTTWS